MTRRHTGIERGFDRLELWWARLPVVRGNARLLAFPGVAVILLFALLAFGVAHLASALAGGAGAPRLDVAVFILVSLPLFAGAVAVFFVRRFVRVNARPASADAPGRGGGG